MQLNEILTSDVWARVKTIQYESVPKKTKPKFTVKDDYKVIELSAKGIGILFSREVVLETNQGYILRVEVDLKRSANKGMDLTALLDEEYIKQNISEICDPIMNYVSLLISQITSSFNRPPIVTIPSYNNQ